MIHDLYEHSKFSIIKKTTEICECKQDTTTPPNMYQKRTRNEQPKQYVAGLVTQVLHYRMSINLRWGLVVGIILLPQMDD